MAARARLSLHFKSRRLADSIAKSLEPELNNPLESRAHASIKVARRDVQLMFQARDVTALRAILTSYMRMISACIRVAEAVSDLDKSD